MPILRSLVRRQAAPAANDAGRIVRVYSGGAIGRLVLEDVTGLVSYVRQHAAASS
jgi:hypothetical protein